MAIDVENGQPVTSTCAARRPVASANISLLYSELPFPARLEQAAADGFSCVEFWEPDNRATIVSEVTANGLAVSCINVASGWEPSDCGRMGDARAVSWWRRNFTDTVELAVELRCRCINTLAGRGGGLSEAEDRAVLLENLTWALETTAGQPLVLLLEALNAVDRPGYMWPTVTDAIAVREQLGAPERLKILFDAYHVHHASQDVTSAFLSSQDAVGHIQLADSPGRGAPGTGEIDVPRLLRTVHASGYDGYVGLEYRPAASSSATFGWMTEVDEWLDGPLPAMSSPVV